ncbi:hypothetical protein A2U01_0040624, partial [Trifolium medium]|nr:hypothetical protein [Trifolium medium]
VNLPPNQAFSLILATDGKLANATNRDAPQTESKYHPPAAPERAGSHAPAFDITSM